MENKKVTIYTTPTCVYCRQAKSYFKQEGIEYEEKDVSTSREALDEMVDKTGQMGVPVIDVSGHVMVGYNQQAFEDLLRHMEGEHTGDEHTHH